MEKRALGKGLSALIPQKEERRPEVAEINVELIRPNRYQPRTEFRESELKELADSIREKGIVQPLIVREADGGYEIIAGERRLRAAKAAGLQAVPAVIRECQDSELLELTLIENLQRDDLNPVEEALGYQKLSEEMGLKQEEIARRVGKDRATVANMLRLLKLPFEIRTALENRTISMGHARAILALDDEGLMLKVLRETVSGRFSVRQVEKLTRRAAAKKTRKDVNVAALEDELEKALGTKVEIIERKKGGKILIHYFSDEQRERVIDVLRKK